MKKRNRVIKAVASRYSILTPDGIKSAVARKKLKDEGIFVGDYVDVAQIKMTNVIEKVLPRKNSLVRPPIANVDVCLIVIAPIPQPDFLLVDKIIINCHREGIKPVLVANKIDIGKVDEIKDYFGIVDVFSVSASSREGIDGLLDSLKDMTVCFAGQSASGKSSIINAFLQSDILKTQAVSKKTKRGKHTTRHTELLVFECCSLIDTCGFSMLDTVDTLSQNLHLYYDEFELLRGLCRFSTCKHINEPECAVKSEIALSVSIGRYNRYVQIYNELKEQEAKKFS